MEYKKLEEKIDNDLKWKTIEDIPNFPVSNFNEIKKKIDSKEFSLSLNPITTLEFSSNFSSGFSSLFFSLFLHTTWIVTIASIILAFVLGNYWLFLGIIVCYVAHFTSLPYVQFKKLCYLVAALLFLVFFYGIMQHKELATYLSLFFILPVLANIFLYDMSYRKLRDVSINSEKIFIYLFQTGKLMLEDNKNKFLFSVHSARNVSVDPDFISKVIQEASETMKKTNCNTLAMENINDIGRYVPFTYVYQKTWIDAANFTASDMARDEGLTGQELKDRATEIFRDAVRVEPNTKEGKKVRGLAQVTAAISK
ncbi:MAG: hypothetical protein ABSE76_02620 [Minisyncoccia bacterium]|jgi:hypothetical protein